MTSDTRGSDAAVVLGGRFRLDDRIAVGGMGEVWAAKDLLLDRDVAVKLLKAEYLEDRGFLARFQAEARHAAGLSHPGIATVYDYGEVNTAPYLVMELVRGEPLSSILARHGTLPVAQALDIAAQTARALGAAHEAGVIHRDVKPGNILVCPDGAVKVTDFGIARATDGVPLTQTGTVIGTARYLSPEQAQGTLTTPASDLYSLGVVTYEMLAGAGPFAATNPIAVALAHVRDEPLPLPAAVPPAVRAFVMRALEKRPQDRYADAAAFAAAAEHAAAVTAGLLPPGALPADTAVIEAVRDPEAGTRVLRTARATGRPAGGRARRHWWLVPVALAILLIVAVAASAMSRDTKRAGSAASATSPA
ncbi:MAG: eukaryotic-like serine/threonine-protein kinase, partial [Frankiaceae bacterium]|nr:eukaryotic-like serine/threonine-protein kinase [Frankiaceae bacterium]